MAEDFNIEGMLDMYLYENGQLLEKLESIIMDYKDQDSFDDTAINEIFRIMHTIKGSSGVMMYENIMTVSHKLEDIFYCLRESRPKDVPHLELLEYNLQVLDFISGELDKVREGTEPDGDPAHLIQELEIFLDRLKKDIKKGGKDIPSAKPEEAAPQFYIAPVVSGGSRYYRICITFHADTAMSNIRAYSAVYSLKELAEDLIYYPEDIMTNEESSKEIMASGFHILLQSQSEAEQIYQLVDNSSEIENVMIRECTQREFVRGLGADKSLHIDLDILEQDVADAGVREAVPADYKDKEPVPGDYVIQSKEPGKGKLLAKNTKKEVPLQEYMSVSVSKMDKLMDLMGEMVIAESVVLQNPDLKGLGKELPNFQKAATQLAKTTSEMQEIIMSMRMMPLSNTFRKMNRTVFDISHKLGKEIEFEMRGESTEVDKNIIEHISDPLMHLVRNAVDHGIETSQERIQAGKTDKGKITLEARNEGGKVWVIVKDNGKGLSKSKLYRKAKENELIPDDKTMSDYSDKEIYNLITLPGFSTKEEVTEFSGRGVGMDVVVRNIQEIGGSLEIDSQEGQGSSMTIKIPLTLAIINGVLMRVGESIFVVESGSIKEFVRMQERMLIDDPSGKEYVMLRDECYPVVRFEDKFHVTSRRSKDHEIVMLVLEYEDKQFCTFVDELLGTQEIVVKPIPNYIRRIPGISGCTQLGDGSVALILDAGGMIQS